MPIVLTPNPTPQPTLPVSTKTLRARHRIGGVLTDYTSLVLSDPTGTYGVKRVDTGEVIVAAGATPDHDGTGLYHIDIAGLIPGVQYQAYWERTYAGFTSHNYRIWVQGVTEADGYYVSRETVLRTAGTDNFNAAFNLDPDSTVADEAIVQEVVDQADRFVDSRALVLGVAAAGTDPHYVETSDPIFGMLSDWASRWARAQGYLLRGTTGDAQATAEGQMQAMKDEAEKRIDELLKNKRWTVAGGIGFGLAATARAALPVLI